jgi:hypothetical protein
MVRFWRSTWDVLTCARSGEPSIRVLLRASADGGAVAAFLWHCLAFRLAILLDQHGVIDVGPNGFIYDIQIGLVTVCRKLDAIGKASFTSSMKAGASSPRPSSWRLGSVASLTACCITRIRDRNTRPSKRRGRRERRAGSGASQFEKACLTSCPSLITLGFPKCSDLARAYQKNPFSLPRSSQVPASNISS